MKICFEGVVHSGDPSRTGWCYDKTHKKDSSGDCIDVSCNEKDGSLWIGDHDVISEVGSIKWEGPITCAIYASSLLGDTAFQGALRIQEGWGYSEYTPVEDDELFVGPHNLIKIISDMEGDHITVWFADETINVLEGR
jgi:hypothetical protein